MLGLAPPAERHVALLRIGLGAYLMVHFAQLLPFSEELFGSLGMLPEPAPRVGDSWLMVVLSVAYPKAPAWLLLLLCAGSLLFLLGVYRRSVAVLLWLAWVALVSRNPFIQTPSVGHVGWLLVAFALIPNEGVWRLGAVAPPRRWAMPTGLRAGAWLLLGVGYSLAGFRKLSAASWLDGSALSHLLSLPSAGDTALRSVLVAQPELVLSAITWVVLCLEISALPLFVLPKVRRIAWFGLTLGQAAALVLFGTADSSAGILLFHAFVFDDGRPRDAGHPESTPLKRKRFGVIAGQRVEMPDA